MDNVDLTHPRDMWYISLMDAKLPEITIDASYSADPADDMASYAKQQTHQGRELVDRVLYVLQTGDHNHILQAAKWLRDTGWGTPQPRVIQPDAQDSTDISLTELIKAARESRRSPTITQNPKH